MLLAEFRSDVAALRFCPMLAPAGEVAAISECDGHTLRARMVHLWRALEQGTAADARTTELLFQTTLDSISEAYAPYHTPVSGIMRAARADAVANGAAPGPVAAVLAELGKAGTPAAPAARKLILMGEIVQCAADDLARSLRNALKLAGHEAEPWYAPTGAAAYALGDRALASRQAAALVQGLQDSTVEEIICDSPESCWMLRSAFPELGVRLPASIRISLFSELLADAAVSPEKKDGMVFVHDSRASYLLAEGEADPVTLKPGFRWETGAKEELCGTGAVYEHARKLADQAFARREWSLWTRGLAKSCGSDDGLWLTYPELARRLALARLDHAAELNADTIVTDSPLAAWWLEQNRLAGHPAILWIPELFRG